MTTTDEKKTRTVTTYVFRLTDGYEFIVSDPEQVVIDEEAIGLTKGDHRYLVRMAHVALYDKCTRQVPVKDAKTEPA
jgi:hypothetical protein